MDFVRGIIRDSYSATRATSRMRKQAAAVELQGSLFCTVREPAQRPLCGYYAAVIERALKLFQIPAEATPSKCRATGDAACSVSVTLSKGPSL
jgi:hypothetical protein